MKELTGKMWCEALLSASNNLTNKKNIINALNVFPVPDGDTGSNMASTIASAVSATKYNDEITLEEASRAIAKNMLLSARGNSGVILSQIFKGFENAFKGKKVASPFDVVQSFEEACKSAYKSVLKPIEGTILTVIRETKEELKAQALMDSSLEQIYDMAYSAARKSCDNTPKLLKVLAEVGVTDSGGEGLYVILEGIRAYFLGKPVELSQEEKEITNMISDGEVFEGEFGYCTEFILDLYRKDKFNKDYLVKKLEKIGNSMVVVNDENLLKVHIHTVKPGNVLNAVNSLGQFIKVKIENMTLQANEGKENYNKKHNIEQQKEITNVELKECGIVSCNSGQGIIYTVKDYGVDYVVEGGQTNNPSIQDIVNAIKAVPAKTVFILPNNSNIILSAQQASTIATDKNIIIIPTKSQAQTVAILTNYSSENSVKDNQKLMKEALKHVSYGEIAPSVKTTKLNGVRVKEGEFMSIKQGKLIDVATTYNEAAIKLVDNLINKDTQLLTIYYGRDVSESDADELKTYLEVNYDVTVDIIQGDQSVYPYLISAE
ncbi:DAK2 domain-containing protein [[Mycoplasma] falconis]|uniref:DAK2 domain-containing protein n=1 Tax=[Mycoplasma] falconis TaxID=92403 RepID=A0A501XAQ3_9BACT|nr:DAK2 domain-containing protein [[Mycoplasma] falconis]TPE57718.1 DAK2 domain-containing protein [[Mycoplasma] falconis]